MLKDYFFPDKQLQTLKPQLKKNSEGEAITRPAKTEVSEPGRLSIGTYTLEELSIKRTGGKVSKSDTKTKIGEKELNLKLDNITYELVIEKNESKLKSLTVHNKLTSIRSTDILGICHILKEHYFLQYSRFPNDMDAITGIKFFKPLSMDEYFEVIIKQHILDFIAFTNYQPHFEPNKPYKYELINTTKINEILTHFSENFLKETDKRSKQDTTPKDVDILISTFNEIFYYKSNDGKRKFV